MKWIRKSIKDMLYQKYTDVTDCLRFPRDYAYTTIYLIIRRINVENENKNMKKHILLIFLVL